MQAAKREEAIPAPVNYATHKTQVIRDWLVKRPRWHVHFTPTSAS